MELQSGFGVDIAMTLDVCPPFPAERAEIEEACRLHAGLGGALPARVLRGRAFSSGSCRAERTRTCGGGRARGLGALGLRRATRSAASRSGSRRRPIREVTALHGAASARRRPRYLMGVGTPADLLGVGARGGGSLRLRSADAATGAWATRTRVAGRSRSSTSDSRKTSRRSTRSAAARSAGATAGRISGTSSCLKDFSAPMLLSMHNVFFYLEWMREIREAIAGRRLDASSPRPKKSFPKEPEDRSGDNIEPFSGGRPGDSAHAARVCPARPAALRRARGRRGRRAARFTYARVLRALRPLVRRRCSGSASGRAIASRTSRPNTHAQLEAFYAVPQIGAVLVPINYRLTADDFALHPRAQRRARRLRARRLLERVDADPREDRRRSSTSSRSTAPRAGLARLRGELAGGRARVRPAPADRRDAICSRSTTRAARPRAPRAS